jgi:hypothetical protein
MQRTNVHPGRGKVVRDAEIKRALAVAAHPHDVALTNLERAVEHEGMSVAGALARAYMLGMDRGAERPTARLRAIAAEWAGCACSGYDYQLTDRIADLLDEVAGDFR